MVKWSYKSELLPHGEVMMMATGEQPRRRRRLLWCVCGERLVATVAVGVLTTIMFHVLDWLLPN
jgi:hypothetical protein